MRYEYEIDPFAAVRSNRNSWNERTVNYHAKMNKLREAIGEDKEEIIKALTEEKSVLICFLLPMPNSWSYKKKRQMHGTYHKQRPDIDNLCKGLTDSIFYQHERNDSEISQLHAIKVWDYKGKIIIDIL